MSPSATRTGALADFGVSFPFFHPYGLLLVLLLFTGKEGSDASLCNKEMMVILSLRIMHCSSIIDERNFYPFLYCLEYMNRIHGEKKPRKDVWFHQQKIMDVVISAHQSDEPLEPKPKPKQPLSEPEQPESPLLELLEPSEPLEAPEPPLLEPLVADLVTLVLFIIVAFIGNR
ncbi:uncharacterized protein LOC122060935 isoform X2 [Macadamia integrifolia]|uniref:uncharacterized protein LOC122060935 isoform X2 n=1 Tax=Macadamia integrifolia TaxID=60698 RepID=UPI001C52B9B2|nr:uncharacterized protein LOC122060935 isoform X2 [Macadamia integrifolia]